jgi:catechol 2,3-dioxygenase-like lactoylglutathione lyase family enzyme
VGQAERTVNEMYVGPTSRLRLVRQRRTQQASRRLPTQLDQQLALHYRGTAGVPGGVAFMVAPAGERLELLAVVVQPSAWDDPIAALRAGVPHTACTIDDLDAAHARAVEAGGRSVWTPRDTPETGLRIAFVADPDGNLVELPSSDEEAPPT